MEKGVVLDNKTCVFELGDNIDYNFTIIEPGDKT
jgi:hypothetical protein